MRYRLFSTLVSFAFVASQPSFVHAMMPTEAYDDAVAFLEKAQVIDGFAAGNPRVHEYLTRAEALKVIVKAQPNLMPEVLRVAASMPPIPLFSDVDQKQWYAPYVEVAFKHGLVKGYPDGKFWPQAGVKTSEAVAMLVRSYKEPVDSAPFRTSDDLENTEGQWYTGPVSILLARDGVMPGNKLKLGAYIRRGEFFDMVYRMRIAHGQGANVVASSPSIPVISVSSASSVPSVMVSSASSSSVASQISVQAPSTKDFAISIPSLGIDDLTITHPEDPSTQKGVLSVLKNGVGHLFGFPGDGGKVLIYGHSSSYPWDLSPFTKIFRTINKIAIGDTVYVTRKGKLFQYQVTEKRTVPAKERSVFEPDDNGEELILYTCWPPDSITHRFLVIAKPVGAVAAK